MMAEATRAETTTLLTLPRELRNEIYSYLLETFPLELPVDLFNSLRRKWRDGPDGVVRDILYPIPGPKAASLSLLLCNRQIAAEIREAAEQRYKSKRLTTELDICVRGYIVSPTWTFLVMPVPDEATLDVKVELRIVSTEGLARNDGWPRQPGVIFRSLLTLLDQFVHNGPLFVAREDQASDCRSHRTIDNLLIIISFCDNYTQATHARTKGEIVHMLGRLARRGDMRQYVRKITARWWWPEKEVYDERFWDVLDEFEADLHNSYSAEQWDEAGFYFGPRSMLRSPGAETAS